MIDIPYDLYESKEEFVIIMPLGGVKKDTLNLKIENNQIILKAIREIPQLKDDLVILEQNCYWGNIETRINLPLNISFSNIYTKLLLENILVITLPKNIEPKDIVVDIEYI